MKKFKWWEQGGGGDPWCLQEDSSIFQGFIKGDGSTLIFSVRDVKAFDHMRDACSALKRFWRVLKDMSLEAAFFFSRCGSSFIRNMNILVQSHKHVMDNLTYVALLNVR